MCFIANFSQELMRKDISKMSLGFIAGLDGISEDMLIKHLIERGDNFNKTRAILSIKTFERFIEHEFWKLVFKSVKQYDKTGVKMYIVGRPELVTVFIRFVFCFMTFLSNPEDLTGSDQKVRIWPESDPQHCSFISINSILILKSKD